jgi:hypothetical protein
MKRGLLAACAVMLSVFTLAVSFAQVTTPAAVVAWLAPTTYVDGSAIAPGDLDHYTITWTASVAGGPAGSMTVPGNTLAANVPFPCGSANFSITVTTSSTSSKYPNTTSDPSSPLVLFDSKVKCAPNPPSGLGVRSSAVSAQAVTK